MRATCPARLILHDLIFLKISGEEYRLCNSLLCSFLRPLFTFFLLDPNVLLSTLKRSQSMLFQCEMPSSTPTKECTIEAISEAGILELYLQILGVRKICICQWCFFWKFSDGKIIVWNKITRDRKIRHIKDKNKTNLLINKNSASSKQVNKIKGQDISW
jgi:hypothetical protein